MRITIEPTNPSEGFSEDAQHLKVSVEHPFDDLTVSAMMDLVKSALLAMSYPPESLADYFGDPNEAKPEDERPC